MRKRSIPDGEGWGNRFHPQGQGNATSDRKGGDLVDFSNMDISDWIIRTAIFGVLACAVLGTLQNIFDAIKKSGER